MKSFDCSSDPCHLAWLIRDNRQFLNSVLYGILARMVTTAHRPRTTRIVTLWGRAYNFFFKIQLCCHKYNKKLLFIYFFS